MKKIWVAALLVLSGCGMVMAAPFTRDNTWTPCAAEFTVLLNTYSWTAVPSSNCTGREVISLVNVSTNTGRLVGITRTASTVPTSSTSTWSIQISPGSDDRGYFFSDKEYLFMKTTHTSGETVTGGEFKSRQ